MPNNPYNHPDTPVRAKHTPISHAKHALKKVTSRVTSELLRAPLHALTVAHPPHTRPLDTKDAQAHGGAHCESVCRLGASRGALISQLMHRHLAAPVAPSDLAACRGRRAAVVCLRVGVRLGSPLRQARRGALWRLSLDANVHTCQPRRQLTRQLLRHPWDPLRVPNLVARPCLTQGI